ncbi:putative flavin-containing monooxygenase [Gordonia effusa NBRC 100432]|uniref:Putative flavin-containing monooxygenase n=1 Tax=Gordonia effusa NBRC 100432 TaxID=1077974 RepID=H0QUI0_9ACTN|nr:NAD(P)/FAD-dependent oxidoreductase [Gordonia effusa]GAB16481.1 putative flavin-containing monooxygenase [Gordonia effusa NBRC 100432]
MSTQERNPRIIIVGAGMAGIATAITLIKHGYTELTIIEKGSDVGGVWHWNHYPGLTCDVPSNLYQYSFETKSDWSRAFATGPEIQRYLSEVADKYQLRGNITFDTEVISAHFVDEHWVVATNDGLTRTYDFVIMATGVLHHPYTPDLPGLANFSGTVVHTAQWDDSLVTNGAKVAVIGTGSTGVQVVSALHAEAAQIYHFVRTPQWILWSPMGLRQPRAVSMLLGRLPFLRTALYRMLLAASGILADVTTTPSWRRRLVQQYARVGLRLQVRDRQLRKELTPDYEPLCKRQVVSNTYYRAVARPNVAVVSGPIDEITETGIRTADGTSRDVDVIVLATGFAAHNYMRPMDLVGRDGIHIEQAWSQGPRAYRMTAIPGFPNLFTVLGPNSPTGSISLQYTAELTAEYIVSWLDRYRAGDLDLVEVTAEATAEFNEQVAKALGPTVWNTGCNSWYLTEGGVVDLWPFDRRTLTDMLTTPNSDHFTTTRRALAESPQIDFAAANADGGKNGNE